MIVRAAASIAGSSVACASLALAACTATQPLRFGAGVGASLTNIEARSTGPASAESLSFDTRGAGGFLEVMVPDETVDLHLRVSAQRSRGDLAGVATDGEVTAQRVAVLLSTPVDLFGSGALRPFFGVSAGHLEVDFDAQLPYERGHRLTGGLVVGLEYELGGHLLLGCSLYGDLWGRPGDTDGTTFESLLYVGVRL